MYTQHLLRAKRMPGLRLADVFKVVGREVESASGGTQSPEEFMKLRDLTPFCFTDGAGCGRVAQAEAPDAAAGTGGAAAGAGGSAGSTGGTAVARPTAREKVTFSTDVFHAAGAVTIASDGQRRLDEVVTMTAGIDLEVVIAVGHAAADEGSAPETQRLSELRAAAVKRYLVSLGIEANRVYTEGKGATAPIGDNRTAEGRAKNRRVELEAVGTRQRRG